MSKLKVLIADDDRAVHKMYAHGLLDDLYEKKIVVNGQEALEVFESWRPDVVVLDIMMPIMSGYQTLKAIRDKEKGSKKPTPVVMVTALASKNDIMDCIKLGIQGYLVKPVKPHELAEKLESCCSREE